MSKFSYLINGPRQSKRIFGLGIVVRRSDTRDELSFNGKTYDLVGSKSHERQKAVDGVVQHMRALGCFQH